jgi:hypothetical protein
LLNPVTALVEVEKKRTAVPIKDTTATDNLRIDVAAVYDHKVHDPMSAMKDVS